MKKNNIIYTEYTIEKDGYDNGYHIHLIIHHKDIDKVNQMLYKFIGGKDCSIREIGLNTFNDFSGIYGHYMTEQIRDENQFRKYINEINQSTTLI
jgi:hypothetical protein